MKLLLVLAVAYAALCVTAWLVQGRLLFYPVAISRAAMDRLRERTGAEELVVDAGGVRLHGLFLPGDAPAPRPTLLYFGGNAEGISYRAGQAREVTREGWNVAAVAYRGYGLSEGAPSAKAILADALAVYDAVAARDDVDRARIATWGTSLGAGVAVHVARHRAVRGVIAAAAYDRLSSVGQRHFPWLPVPLLFRHEIAPAQLAPGVSAPLLLVHGTADDVVPVDHARRLGAAWGGTVTTRLLEGRRHDDLEGHPGFHAAVLELLHAIR